MIRVCRRISDQHPNLRETDNRSAFRAAVSVEN